MAPPVSSASVAPDSGERTASSRPWITSTGQRTRAASSRAVSSSNRAALRRDQRLRRGLQTPADAVLDLLGRVRLGEDLREEEGQEAGVVAQPVVAVVLGPPLVGVQLVVERGRRPCPRRLGGERHRRPDEDGTLDPVRMVRPPAAGRAGRPSSDRPRRLRSVSVASRTAIASAAYSASAYASGSSGRSDRPFPRPSKVITRKCRARYGTCIFHACEWTIAQVGSSSTVVAPLPKTS